MAWSFMSFSSLLSVWNFIDRSPPYFCAVVNLTMGLKVFTHAGFPTRTWRTLALMSVLLRWGKFRSVSRGCFTCDLFRNPLCRWFWGRAVFLHSAWPGFFSSRPSSFIASEDKVDVVALTSTWLAHQALHLIASTSFCRDKMQNHRKAARVRLMRQFDQNCVSIASNILGKTNSGLTHQQSIAQCSRIWLEWLHQVRCDETTTQDKLWFLETCLMLELWPLLNILITASLTTKTKRDAVMLEMCALGVTQIEFANETVVTSLFLWIALFKTLLRVSPSLWFHTVTDCVPQTQWGDPFHSQTSIWWEKFGFGAALRSSCLFFVWHWNKHKCLASEYAQYSS